MNCKKTLLKYMVMGTLLSGCQTAEELPVSKTVTPKLPVTVRATIDHGAEKCMEEYCFGLEYYYPTMSYLSGPEAWLETQKARKKAIRILTTIPEAFDMGENSLRDKNGVLIRNSEEPAYLLDSYKVTLTVDSNGEFDDKRQLFYLFLLGNDKKAEYVMQKTIKKRSEQLEIVHKRNQYKAEKLPSPLFKWHRRGTHTQRLDNPVYIRD